MKLVAYYRVSTERQGRSGLGLQAQRVAVEAYARQCGGEVLEAFTEVESGKHADRPQLESALRLARITGATLVIAKLDRLSRDAHFLFSLKKEGARFVAADMPHANELTVGIMAVVAEEERKAISRRTREALAAAKARGAKLGNPKGAEPLRRAGKGNVAAVQAAQSIAEARARDLAPKITELRLAGVVSLSAIAAALNERGILSARGGPWHKASVRNLLARCDALTGPRV